MALIATPGDALANSFVSQGDATILLSTTLHTAPWRDAAGPDRDAALVTATRQIVQWVAWDGAPTTTTQALPWPQLGAADARGRVLLSTVIPPDIQLATALYANALLAEADEPPGSIGVEALDEFRMGDTALVFRKGGRPVSAMQQLPPEVRRLLTPYGDVVGGGTIRLVRT